MTYKLIISERAEEHINNIVGYVAVELANPTAAKAILSDIESICWKTIIMLSSIKSKVMRSVYQEYFT